MTGSNDMFPIENSSLYQRYLLERKEIDKIEWIESERMGYSVGRYRAEWIWLTTYRSDWIKEWYAKNRS